MQNEIIAKIDALVKMSDSTSDISTLKVELREIECDIKEKKLEIKELKSSMNDDKYFDASGEIVDKNIEISLTHKIKLLKKTFVDIENQLNEVKEKENIVFNDIQNTKDNILDIEKFIEVLKAKIKSKKEKNNFEELLKENETKIKKYKKSLEKMNKEYEKIQGKIEVLSFSKSEVEEKINSESDKLKETKSSLNNKSGYVDIELKKQDQDRLDSLIDSVVELEKEKLNILNDPVMVGETAKNYLINDDKTSCLNKLKELKNELNELPYMNVENYSSDSLDIELENAEAKRDEFASMINTKNYESVDATLIKDRITFNNSKKDDFNNQIETIKNDIKLLDNEKLEDLNNRINYCENEAASLEEKIKEYQETLNNIDNTSSKKASLQASFDKKQEELENIKMLLDSYKKDRQELIENSYDMENSAIEKLLAKIELIDEENNKLDKIILSLNKAKDVIAIENDKKELKHLNDIVKSIKRRKTFKSSPNQMCDEIEILLGTSEDEKVSDEIEDTEIINPEINLSDLNVSETEEKETDNMEINDSEFEIPSIDIAMDDLNELKEETPVIEEKENDETKIDIDQLPVIEDELDVPMDSIDEPEKLKVINVETLDSNEENESPDSDFLIGDYTSDGEL